jgi:hypothetical protein
MLLLRSQNEIQDNISFEYDIIEVLNNEIKRNFFY